MSGRVSGLIASNALVALVVAVLTLAPTAGARTAANLSLNVTFTAAGSISVTLADGTPVGVTSGSPTVIPAGFYTVLLSGPGGCTQVPVFELKGPGENILDDLTEGEVDFTSHDAYFLPNSTYTWRNDAAPSVVYTFVTSSQVLGTQPAPNTSVSSTKETVSSQDVVGSETVASRGSLAGTVSAAGRLGLAYKGKSAASLKAGRYTITVLDKSATSGFMLEKAKHSTVSVSGVAFVGKHSTTVTLTAGTWFFVPTLSGKRTPITVK